MNKQDRAALLLSIKTIANQIEEGSIQTPVFDDLDLEVIRGVRAELKKRHIMIRESDDGSLMYGAYVAPKGARAKKVGGPKLPKPVLVAAFEAQAAKSNDPDHHDVFEGGKAGVEVTTEDLGYTVSAAEIVAAATPETRKREYNHATDALTLAFKELRSVKLTDGRRIAFGKDIAGKDPIAEQSVWLHKNFSRVGALAITLRGKEHAGKVYIMADTLEIARTVEEMVRAKLPEVTFEHPEM